VRTSRRLAALIPPVAVLLIGVSGKLIATIIVPGFGPGTGWIGDWHSVLERSFWVQADLFTFGMALAVLRVEDEEGLLRLPRWWRAATFAAMGAIALPTAALYALGKMGQYPYDTAMALACGLLLATVVLRGDAAKGTSATTRLLESRPLVAAGLVSYSLFLWHEPLIRWLQERGLTAGGSSGFLFNLLVVASVAGLLSVFSYRFVELPALRRKSYGRMPVPREPEVAMAEAQNEAAP
jgi:peptidoglycan/LPS O-acetylase OafA/YrhL